MQYREPPAGFRLVWRLGWGEMEKIQTGSGLYPRSLAGTQYERMVQRRTIADSLLLDLSK